MKSSKRIFVAAMLALPLAAFNLPALAASDAHDHGHEVHGEMELNHGKKWETDAALRQGMTAIHGIVSGAIDDAHAGKMSEAKYTDVSKQVMTQFNYVVENCKLEPEADAQLHILLGNMVQGVELVEGKVAGEKRDSGLVKIAQALNSYGDFFDHPDWKAIDLTH